MENLAGYVVEAIERPPGDGPATVAVLLHVRATTSRRGLADALRLVEASTSAAICSAGIVTRPRWLRTRADAVTSIRLPDVLLSS